MRKFVFLMLLLALSAAPAAAQTIGFKIGPTFSKLDFEGDLDDDLDNLTSFGGGGFIRFGMGGLRLQAEVLAVSKGISAEDLINEGEDSDFSLTYVEIPVTAMFSLGNAYLFAGPAVSFEVSCDVDVGALSGECDENDGSRKETDFSLTGGLGIEFPAGPGNILLEGRYSHGLTDLNDSDDPAEQGSIKTRYFAIFAGYAIPIGR